MQSAARLFATTIRFVAQPSGMAYVPRQQSSPVRHLSVATIPQAIAALLTKLQRATIGVAVMLFVKPTPTAANSHGILHASILLALNRRDAAVHMIAATHVLANVASLTSRLLAMKSCAVMPFVPSTPSVVRRCGTSPVQVRSLCLMSAPIQISTVKLRARQRSVASLLRAAAASLMEHPAVQMKTVVTKFAQLTRHAAMWHGTPSAQMRQATPLPAVNRARILD